MWVQIDDKRKFKLEIFTDSDSESVADRVFFYNFITFLLLDPLFAFVSSININYIFHTSHLGILFRICYLLLLLLYMHWTFLAFIIVISHLHIITDETRWSKIILFEHGAIFYLKIAIQSIHLFFHLLFYRTRTLFVRSINSVSNLVHSNLKLDFHNSPKSINHYILNVRMFRII